MPRDTVDARAFDQFILRAEAALKTPVIAAVVTNDPEVQEYWRVLEFGAKPGNPHWRESGERIVENADGRIFSRQAPKGFIFRHASKFVRFLREAIAKRLSARTLTRKTLAEAANEAAERAADLIRSGAPVDTGKLIRSIDVQEAR